MRGVGQLLGTPVATRIEDHDHSPVVDERVEYARSYPVDVRVSAETVVQQHCRPVGCERIGVVVEDVVDHMGVVVGDELGHGAEPYRG